MAVLGALLDHVTSVRRMARDAVLGAIGSALLTMWPVLAIIVLLALVGVIARAATLRMRVDGSDSPAAVAPRGERQREAVAAVDFAREPLLNREEFRLLPMLEAFVRDNAPNHRVMAQVSMGEIIKPVAVGASPALLNRAFLAINAKRLDFSIFDASGLIVAAIEYQGSGHYGKGAEARDAVKREVMRKAGVPLIEVHPGTAFKLVEDRLKAILTEAKGDRNATDRRPAARPKRR
jgi:hypothetical protein